MPDDNRGAPQERTGSDAIVTRLLADGVDTCFANPGTSELPFVAALDRNPAMQAVLALHENVATGAADGYGRMRDAPAATLLHLGPGLANGLACLHNARRARTPVVNLIGEHASHHVQYDAPLTTDVEGVARPFSDWVGTVNSTATAADEASRAVATAREGKVASLILPADSCWGACPEEPSPRLNSATPATEPPENTLIDRAARQLRTACRPLLLLGGLALREEPLRYAAKIAETTGAEILAATHNARVERGAGRIAIDRLPYPVQQARARLADTDCLLLIGARAPVAFFAYPGQPSDLVPPGCAVFDLTPQDPGRGKNAHAALAALADAVGAGAATACSAPPARPGRPGGDLTPDSIAQSLCRWMPERAIVAEDAVTSGRAFFPSTHQAAPHDWLQTTGGAIGHGLPMATGAAVACPDRRVICLQADGAGMYTLQALWTQARESLDVTTVIFANRRYAILRDEFRNIGIQQVGPRAELLTSLADPVLDWAGLARGMGVSAQSVDTAGAFDEAFEYALRTTGPFLIEAIIP